MEENHEILQENIPELKDMNFQTENVQQAPSMMGTNRPTQRQNTEVRTEGKSPPKNRGGGEKNGSPRKLRNLNGFRLLNTRNYKIMEQCLQNPERKLILRKNIKPNYH